METRALRYGLAQNYFDAREYRRAIHELTGIVEHDPQNVSVRMLLARSYYYAALLAPAEKQLREVIELDPTESYAHHMLARTLERQSRRDEATKYRRIAAALTGNDDLLRPHGAAPTEA